MTNEPVPPVTPGDGDHHHGPTTTADTKTCPTCGGTGVLDVHDISYEDLIPEIEIALGWGCNAEHVSQVLQLMDGKPRTSKAVSFFARQVRMAANGKVRA